MASRVPPLVAHRRSAVERRLVKALSGAPRRNLARARRGLEQAHVSSVQMAPLSFFIQGQRCSPPFAALRMASAIRSSCTRTGDGSVVYSRTWRSMSSPTIQ